MAAERSGLSVKEAQEALDAVTITEKRGLTNNDGFGEMRMKVSEVLVSADILIITTDVLC